MIYQRGETIQFTFFYGDYNSVGITGANIRIEVYDISGNNKLVNDVAMTEVSGYPGLYKYNYTLPTNIYNKDLLVSKYLFIGNPYWPGKYPFVQERIRVVDWQEKTFNKVDENDGNAF